MSDLTLQRTYDRPSDQVWRALTSSDAIRRWLGARDFVLAVGHAFTIHAPPGPGFDGVARCEITEIRAPSRLAFSFLAGAIDSRVVLDLVARGDRTVVTLRHLGLGPEGERRLAPLIPAWEGLLRTPEAPASPWPTPPRWLVGTGVGAVVLGGLLWATAGPEVDAPPPPDLVRGEVRVPSPQGTADAEPPPSTAPAPAPSAPPPPAGPGPSTAGAPSTGSPPPTPKPVAPLIGHLARPAPRAEPRGTLVLYETSNVGTMHPLFVTTDLQRRVVDLVFDRLVTPGPQPGTWESDVVQRYEIPETRDEVTVWLLPGVEWHDDTPLTGDDVCSTVDLLLANPDASLAAPVAGAVAGCEVVARGSATLTLEHPHPQPLALLDFPVLPAHVDYVDQRWSRFSYRPIGTGPMRAAHGRNTIRLTARPNAHHQPRIREIRLHPGLDATVNVEHLLRGTAHGVVDLAPRAVTALEGDERVQIVPFGPARPWGLALSTEGPLADPALRRALDAALDRDALARTGLPPSLVHPAPGAPLEPADPEALAAAMTEAGARRVAGRWTLRGGIPLELTVGVSIALRREAPDLDVELGNQLARAGFGVDVRLVPDPELDPDAAQGLDIVVRSWSPGDRPPTALDLWRVDRASAFTERLEGLSVTDRALYAHVDQWRLVDAARAGRE